MITKSMMMMMIMIIMSMGMSVIVHLRGSGWWRPGPERLL